MQTTALKKDNHCKARRKKKNILVTADEFLRAERGTHPLSSATQQAVVNMVFKEADVTA